MIQRPAPRLAPWLTAALSGALLVLAGLGAGGCSRPEFDPIPAGQVDAKRQASAEELGHRILSAWAKDEYPPLGDEAREEFRKAHNDVDAQKSADKQLEKEIGNFKSMSFHEALRSKDGKMEIYRFKGTFEKLANPSEVRVVFDAAGKLAGFWVKPWRDTL